MSVETSADASVSGAKLPGLDLSPYADGPGDEAWALLARLFFRYGRPRIMNAGHELELSPPQGILLRFLDEPRPMGELAGLMRCDNSNMTGIVDRMEERGLVERTAAEGDRRVKLIALTGRGRKLREEMDRRMADAPEPIKRLSTADQEALRDLLERALAAE